jgi:hypothetical protein
MEEQPQPELGALRVWHIPQVPGQSFYVPVQTIAEGRRICDLLGDYDLFQYKHRIKPDYFNMNGVERFEDFDGERDWCEIEEDDDA